MKVQILKFYGDWCTPCKTLTTLLDSENFPITAINVDLKPEKSIEFKVRNVPTLVFVDEEGKELDRIVGMTTVKSVKDKMDELQQDKRD